MISAWDLYMDNKSPEDPKWAQLESHEQREWVKRATRENDMEYSMGLKEAAERDTAKKYYDEARDRVVDMKTMTKGEKLYNRLAPKEANSWLYLPDEVKAQWEVLAAKNTPVYTVTTDLEEIEHRCCYDAVLLKDGERIGEFMEVDRAKQVADLLNAR